MKVGTKSVLWGVHCFFIHPFFVAWGWATLYGFPTDPRLWVAFFVHDLGYLQKSDMDGPEGETHVELGARLMERWFGPTWGDFCRYHSRFYSKRDGRAPSRLCFADKMVPSLEPWWLYLPRAWASGELWEYLARAAGRDGGKYANEPNSPQVQALLSGTRWRDWYNGMALFSKEYALAHKDGGADTWTLRTEQ
jgi:hypothetical protein